MFEVTAMLVAIQNAFITTYNGVQFITGLFQNIRANNYNLSNIITLTPYGQGGFPVPGIKGMLIPDQQSNKNAYYCVGFSCSIPPGTPYTPIQGESWSYSSNYMLTQQNTSITAYRINDATYYATLPSGEWMNKIFTDIISRLDSLETSYNTHVHTGVSTGSSNSGTPLVPLLPDPDLIADQTAIDNENTLINDSGNVPS